MRKTRRRIRLPSIAPSAIQAYTERALDNFDFMKAVPKDELTAEINTLGYRFCSNPWIHQMAGFMIGATTRPDFLFYYDMGSGKTKLIYDLFRYRRMRGEASSALIVVPESIHMTTWVEQINDHAPDLKLCVLSGSREERFALLNRKADVYLINHGGLQVYMADLVKNKRVLNEDSAAAFATHFDFLVLEEVHRIKSHTSLLFKLLSWLSWRCPFRYGLTGTPFGRNPETLWPQFKLIDHGATLGETLGMFRAVFFDGKPNYWGGVDYTFRPEQTDLLHRVIKHRSLSYTSEELTELPRRIALIKRVDLTEEGQEYYKRITDRIKETKGDYRSLDSAYIRMRQCASGFLSLKPEDDSESTERIQFRVKHNPKLEALRALIEDRIAGRKFIVYHHFRYSGQMIAELLTELKVGYAEIRGGMKDVQGEFRRFMEDKKCQGLIANTQVGSEAINPQSVCNIEIYFESPDDPITRTQAERRVRRSGQKESHVFIYDIVAKGTIEEKLLRYHREGKNLLAAVLTGDELLIDEETDLITV